MTPGEFVSIDQLRVRRYRALWKQQGRHVEAIPQAYELYAFLALKVPNVLRIEVINEGRYLLWNWTNVPGADVKPLYPGDGERAHWRSDELPKVVREKLAMLRMVDRGTELESVGRRLAETVFWIFGEGV